MVSHGPTDSKFGSHTSKQSPVGAHLPATDFQPVRTSHDSPRLAGAKQERYPAGGIRSKPAKKVESPGQRQYNHLKLKQQSAELIGTTPGAGQISPAEYQPRTRAAPPGDVLNRKSVNESVRRSAVTVVELLQRGKGMGKAESTNDSANLSLSA